MSEPSSQEVATMPPRKRRKLESYSDRKERLRLAMGPEERSLRALDLTVYIKKLPCELREMVFEDAMEEELGMRGTKRRTPALVNALRDTEFYDQVLKIWYAGTYMRLCCSSRHSPSLDDMTPAAFLRLKKLRVDVRVVKRSILGRTGPVFCVFPNLYTGNGRLKKILQAQNLQEVCLNIDDPNRLASGHFIYLVDMWLTHFKSIKKLVIEGGLPLNDSGKTMTAINSRLHNLEVSEERQLEYEEWWMDSADDYLEDLDHEIVAVAIWEAEKGKVLTWNKEV